MLAPHTRRRAAAPAGADTTVHDTREIAPPSVAVAVSAAGDRTGTIMYAMGWTQHTVGTQNIRAMAMIQLLLGNIGMSGGGVNALRGESNVQGSTDHCLLFNILPGYLKTPRASNSSFATTSRLTMCIKKYQSNGMWAS